MARLPAGVLPVPHKTRLKGYRADLELRGGRRLNAEIEKPANDALREVFEVLLADDPKATIKDAVTAALIGYAGSIKRARQ